MKSTLRTVAIHLLAVAGGFLGAALFWAAVTAFFSL